ncbi:TPA: hypothetical protein JTJ93_000228 [Escherichia coli]|nr:hypothetical protein [Escherichia coli]HAX7981149.1 hypothetical protein [Escherichia coli]
MNDDIADRLKILNDQLADAKQLRKHARIAHRNDEAESLTAFINFTNRCILECYREDAENWLDSLPKQTLHELNGDQ